MNQIALIGRLAATPERRESGNTVYSKFTLAVPDGRDKVMWVPVTAFGQTAEFITAYGTKGRRLGITGRLQITERDKVSTAEVICSHAEFTDNKNAAAKTEVPDPFA